MRVVELNQYQRAAIKKMKNGCILVGDVGSGKSRTALAYVKETSLNRDIYIITTAKKRDSNEWEDEAAPFRFTSKVVVDSWNNIKKYKDVYGAFFIFDEQRVVGSGAWVKAFLNITRKNRWILLSATPGDKWADYIPVFVANGFYKNKTDFNRQHCIFSRFTKYPKIEKYLDEGTLLKHKVDISVPLQVDRHTHPNHLYLRLPYNKELYKTVWKDRWDPYEDEPIEETGKLFYLLRKVTNDDDSRYETIEESSSFITSPMSSTGSDKSLKNLGLTMGNGTEKYILRYHPLKDGFTWFNILPDAKDGTA